MELSVIIVIDSQPLTILTKSFILGVTCNKSFLHHRAFTATVPEMYTVDNKFAFAFSYKFIFSVLKNINFDSRAVQLSLLQCLPNQQFLTDLLYARICFGTIRKNIFRSDFLQKYQFIRVASVFPKTKPASMCQFVCLYDSTGTGEGS